MQGFGQKRIIVAFSGKMGCGKDTAADFLAEIGREYGVKFASLRFAGKLRECISILTVGALPPEKTQSSADKARALPKHVFGKTLIDAKLRMLGAVEVMLGRKICVGPLHPADDSEYLYPISYEVLLKAISIITGTTYTTTDAESSEIKIDPTITVGRLLQLFGTDVGRNLFDQNVWIKATERDWISMGRPLAILRDLRFPDEFKFVDSIGLAFLVDADEKQDEKKSSVAADGRALSHISETALSQIPLDKFTAILKNNGTVEDLKLAVRSIVWPSVASRIEHKKQ